MLNIIHKTTLLGVGNSPFILLLMLDIIVA